MTASYYLFSTRKPRITQGVKLNYFSQKLTQELENKEEEKIWAFNGLH